MLAVSGRASTATLQRVAAALGTDTVVVTHGSGSSPFARQLADWFTDNGTPVTFIDLFDREPSTDPRPARVKARDGGRVIIDAPDLSATAEVATVAREADVVALVDVDTWSSRDLSHRLDPIRRAGAAANLIVLARTPSGRVEP